MLLRKVQADGRCRLMFAASRAKRASPAHSTIRSESTVPDIDRARARSSDGVASRIPICCSEHHVAKESMPYSRGS